MPSLLSDADKDIVKRTVPKASNKIQAVAVVRLYVAYPNRSRWTYTGLQGAAVLSNDLVGHTFWIKLVDISVSTHMYKEGTFADPAPACQSRCDMGSRNLRYISIQSRSDLLSLLRD